MERASQKMEAIDSFRFELEHEGGRTPIALGLEMERAVGDIARPGRLTTTISATWDGTVAEVELITVGQTTYLRMTYPLALDWEPLPNEFSAVGLFDPAAGITAVMKSVTNLSKLKDEKVGGILCYHLKGSIDSSSLRPITGVAVEGMEISTDAWIGKEDFLLHQVRFEGQITETEKPGIVRILKLSNFDQPVTIELPR